VLVDAHDPALCADRVHDRHRVRVEEGIELCLESMEARGLDLDELVAADEIDDEAAERDLGPIAGPGVPVLERGMQRSLSELADRHARELRRRADGPAPDSLRSDTALGAPRGPGIEGEWARTGSRSAPTHQRSHG